MKPTRSPQNQDQDQEIIELLQKLKSHEVGYPSELLAARRAAFVTQVQQHAIDKIKEGFPVNGHFTKRLKELKSVQAEYPPELLAARRAAFIAQVEEHTRTEVTEELSSKDQDLIKLFNAIKSAEAGTVYPQEMMAARRAAFIAQIEQHTSVEATEELSSKDQELIKLFNAIKSAEAGAAYPQQMLAARRASFRRQAALGGGLSLLDALRTFIQKLFLYKLRMPSLPPMRVMRTALIVAVLMVAALATSLFRDREQLLSPAPTAINVESSPHPTSTNTSEAAKVICKAGYEPPLCLAKEAKKEESLTYQGNGTARPAVAKDTVPGYSGVHRAAYVNDGLYGPGASWVSNSAYSWIKIDLGKTTTINTVTFGRDRLGNYNDGDPGQFVIAVAMSDNVYADGNSTNDYVEYTQVYDSKKLGFDGIVSGSETISALFRPVKARFVKITFANAGTAVDEVEVFMAQPLGSGNSPTRKPRDEQAGAAATFIPVYDIPVLEPTDTYFVPAHTPIPQPADTEIPAPINTPRPPNTATPVPPTDIPPTDVPPTDIPPTDIPPTDVPPTDEPPPNTPITTTDSSQPTPGAPVQ